MARDDAGSARTAREGDAVCARDGGGGGAGAGVASGFA
jgi:hypothetical protein